MNSKLEDLAICVARLSVVCKGVDAHVAGSIPLCHQKFILPRLDEEVRLADREPGSATLTLNLNENAAPKDLGSALCLWRSENWELWQDDSGAFSFISHHDGRDFQIDLDASFTNGEITGDLSASEGAAFYPLEHMGILLYVNWLANSGDFLLHASGVCIDGRGYCFIGKSGAGKSTLVEGLSANPGLTVLGEDQVIIRFIDGRFWMFGTPWHTRPGLCAPLGVPLEKIFFLDRSLAPQLLPLAPAAGVTRIVQTAFIPFYRPGALDAILSRLALLAEAAPFRLLSYRLGTDVLPLILGD